MGKCLEVSTVSSKALDGLWASCDGLIKDKPDPNNVSLKNNRDNKIYGWPEIELVVVVKADVNIHPLQLLDNDHAYYKKKRPGGEVANREG